MATVRGRYTHSCEIDQPAGNALRYVEKIYTTERMFSFLSLHLFSCLFSSHRPNFNSNKHNSSRDLCKSSTRRSWWTVNKEESKTNCKSQEKRSREKQVSTLETRLDSISPSHNKFTFDPENRSSNGWNLSELLSAMAGRGLVRIRRHPESISKKIDQT